jgi:23S rRNA pseudouridine955/2504/2580 synthase
MNELGKISPKMTQTGAPATSETQVSMVEIGDEAAGQRIDNYLVRACKGVPKSHIYRILRSGEVRVNKGRVDAAYRLAMGDVVRVPPIRVAAPSAAAAAPAAEFPIVFEDDFILALDKPAGVAVHGGSGVSFGVIEQLRRSRPEAKFLELVHRLDRDTSGILLLAKKRSALVNLHEQMRGGQTDKRYLACAAGEWLPDWGARRAVKAALYKYLAGDGERRVRVQDDGQASHTVFNLLERLPGFVLLEAELKTGRTHQIRVHLAHLGLPLAGDDKYGDFALNKTLARANAQPGLKRMFLHAHRLRVAHPSTGLALALTAPLPGDCKRFLQQLGSTFTHG